MVKTNATLTQSGMLPFRELFSRAGSFLQTHLRTVFVLVIPSIVIAVVLERYMATLPVAIGAGGAVTVDFGAVSALHIAVFALLTLASVAINFFVQVACWVLAVRKAGQPASLFAAARDEFVPMVAIAFWIFIRSYAWLALLGVLLLAVGGYAGAAASPLMILGFLLIFAGGVLAAVHAPYFLSAQLLHLRDGKAPLASVDESRTRSEDAWGKIIGNSLLLGLCLAGISILASIAVGMVSGALTLGSTGMIAATVSTLLQTAVSGVMGAMGVFFGAELSATVVDRRAMTAA